MVKFTSVQIIHLDLVTLLFLTVLTTPLADDGELAKDIWVRYAREPESLDTDNWETTILTQSGKLYYFDGVIPGSQGIVFKKMHKLGGVSNVLLLETNDKQFYGFNPGLTERRMGSSLFRHSRL